MKIIKLLLIIILLIIFPTLLEGILKWDSFFFIDIDTDFKIVDWFTFWGSYLGAIGTIILGYIAYKQNITLAEANKELDNIQKVYFDSITRPVIKIGKVSHFKYEKKRDVGSYFEDNIDTMYPVVFKKFRNNYENDVCWFLRFQLPIISTSDIPLIDFKISDFKWKINDKTYEFMNITDDVFCKLPYDGELNLCTLCLIYPDMRSSDIEFQEAGRDIQLYIESSRESRESRATFDITVRNQLDKSRQFFIELDLYWETKFQVHIKRYFIKPYDI